MKSPLRYIILFFAILCISGCTSCKQTKRLDNFISLRTEDKIPYGTFFAYEQLPAIFPGASIFKNTQSPKQLFYDTAGPSFHGQLKTLMIVEQSISPDSDEVRALIHFAASGHQVFISATFPGEALLRSLHLKIGYDPLLNDSPSLRLFLPQAPDSADYHYPGSISNQYFSSFDSAHSIILGANNTGKPDFIRIGFQHEGAIFVHLEPLAFSNFFLLHRQNASYFSRALSYLPKDTDNLMWDDYFHNRKQEDFSALRFILSNRALRWAFWLLVGLFFLLYVVESKRKQRILITRTAPGNASVDFVKTIGRLYLQQKDNRNLAGKMITAFLEQVRLNYNLPTSVLNDEFSNKLALRSGQVQETVRKLIESIHEARTRPVLSDQELMDLHQQIEIFNKPA